MTVCEGDSAGCWDLDVLHGPLWAPKVPRSPANCRQVSEHWIFSGKESGMSLEQYNTW